METFDLDISGSQASISSIIEYKKNNKQADNFLLERKYEQVLLNCAKAWRYVQDTNYYIEQIACASQMATAFCHKTELDYLKATALLNYALNLTNLVAVDQRNEIKQKLLQQNDIVTRLFTFEIFKKEINQSILANLSKYKKFLNDLRETAKFALSEINKLYPYDDIYPNEEYETESVKQLQSKRAEAVRELYKHITYDIKCFLTLLIEDCFQFLGYPPCKFTVLGLGSLARQEITPYSDIEFAILIAKDDIEGFYKQYFRDLTKLLHFIVINLGETILPSMAIESLDWLYDNITPRGFAFDGAMPKACKTPLGKKGVFELIDTPLGMSKYFDIKVNDVAGNHWYQVEPQLVNILSTVTCIYGSKELLNNYHNLINKKLDDNNSSLRKELFLTSLYKNVETFNLVLHDDVDDGRLYIIEKELYRLPSLMIDQLAHYLNIDYKSHGSYSQSRSAWKRLKRMFLAKFLNANALYNLQLLVSTAMDLRLRTYIANKGQKELMSIIKANKANDFPEYCQAVKEIFCLPITNAGNEINIIYKFHYILYALCERVQDYCLDMMKQPLKYSNKDFYHIDFINTSLWVKAQLSARFLNYQFAIQQLEPFVVKRLGEIKHSKFHVGWDVHDLVTMISHLANYFLKLGDYKKNEYYLNKQYELLSTSTTYIRIRDKNYVNVSQLNDFFIQREAVLFYSMGMNFIHQAKYNEAKISFENALQLYMSIDEVGISVAETKHSLAGLYLKKEQETQKPQYLLKAELYCREALNICKKLKEGDRVKSAKAGCYATLGGICTVKRDYSLAKRYLLKALAIFNQLYSSLHPKILSVYSNLALLFGYTGELLEQERYTRKIINSFQDIYKTKDHPEFVANVHNLANNLICQKIYPEAEQYLQFCYEYAKQKYDNNHPDIISAARDLIRVLVRQGNKKTLQSYDIILNDRDSLPFIIQNEDYSRAADIYEEINPFKDILILENKQSNVQLIRSTLFVCCGDSAYNNDKLEEAIEHYQVAALIYDKPVFQQRYEELCRIKVEKDKNNNKSEKSFVYCAIDETIAKKYPEIKNQLPLQDKEQIQSQLSPLLNKSKDNALIKRGFFNQTILPFEKYYDTSRCITDAEQVTLAKINTLLCQQGFNYQFKGYLQLNKDYYLDGILEITIDKIKEIQAYLNSINIPSQIKNFTGKTCLIIEDINGAAAKIIQDVWNKIQKQNAYKCAQPSKIF